MNNPGSIFALGFLLFLAALVIGVLLAWPIQLLWNYCLTPAVDGINPIGFWQAYGIYVLGNLLFRSSSKIKSKDNK